MALLVADELEEGVNNAMRLRLQAGMLLIGKGHKLLALEPPLVVAVVGADFDPLGEFFNDSI